MNIHLQLYISSDSLPVMYQTIDDHIRYNMFSSAVEVLPHDPRRKQIFSMLTSFHQNRALGNYCFIMFLNYSRD